MATLLNIFMNVNGEAIAEDYKFKYTPNMTNTSISNKNLFIVYGVELDKEDIIDFGTKTNLFDNRFPPDEQILKLFTKSDETLFNMINFIKTRLSDESDKIAKTLSESKEKGILKNNVELLLNLILKRKQNIHLKNEVYTISESNINDTKDLKVNEKTATQVESVSVKVDIDVYKGEVNRQKISCISKRQRLRKSFKNVFNTDFLGKPKKSNVIPVLLITPSIATTIPRLRYPRYRNYPRNYARYRNYPRNYERYENILGGKKHTKLNKTKLTKHKKQRKSRDCLTKHKRISNFKTRKNRKTRKVSKR